MMKKILVTGLFLSMSLFLVVLTGTTALAQDTTVKLVDTVTTALEYSPRLQVLEANQEAIGYERDRAQGGYYPQVDVAFAYGLEAHSDRLTRDGNASSQEAENITSTTVSKDQSAFHNYSTTAKKPGVLLK